MFVIKDDSRYLGTDMYNKVTIVSDLNRATKYKSAKKAFNALNNLPYLFSKREWKVWDMALKEYIILNSDGKISDKNCEKTIKNNAANGEFNSSDNISVKNSDDNFEFSDDFDIRSFLESTLPVFTNLKVFYEKKRRQEQLVNDKLLDLRHYLRDNVGKINAIQMQRLGYYQQKLEKEREIAKKSYTIVNEILKDPSSIVRCNFVKMVADIFETPYKCRVLSYEELAEISNTQKGKAKAEKSA